MFYRKRSNCSMSSTEAQLATATTIRLFFQRDRATATIRPTAPLIVCSVADKMAGKVMAARQAGGT